ncbi:MAG TPA: SurA N-terminal domain-containing protein [Burkholderiaceae bacterium]
MFDFVRSNSRAVQVVMGFVLLVFALAGGGGVYKMFTEANEAVASVDGKEITRAEWDARQRQAIENLRRQGPNADLKSLDTPAAKRAALEAIVRERVMDAAVHHENLGVSDARVESIIRNDPRFAQLRAMDPKQRQAVLAQQGMTQDAFFERVRDQFERAQPLEGITASELLPAASTKASLDAWLGQREIQWQRFDAKEYAAQIQPTDAQVKAYYEDKAHAAEFKAPEEAKIEYVVFGIDALKPQMSLNPDEIKKFYEDNKDHFKVEEERRASHIQVSVDPKASPADVAKAKARADAILAEVRKNPASFAEVAKKESDDAGTKAQGGDLDFLSRKSAPPGPFADTLFSMKEGQISDVIRAPDGFEIIQMTGVRGGAPRPFEDVRPQIEDQRRTELAQKAFASGADKFTNLVFEQPDALPTKVDDGSASYKLVKQTAVVHRQPDPGATGPLASKRLLDAVFAADSVKGKHNTEAVDAGSSQLVSAHVVEYHPEHVRALAEVHDQVVEAVRKAAAAAAAKKDGEARAEAARKDATLALPLTATVGRAAPAPDVPREVVDAALKADITKGPAVAGIPLADGGYAVVRVAKDVPRKADDPQAERLKGLIEQAFGEAESQAVYESLKTRYKTKLDERRVAKGTQAAASAAE